MTLHLSYLDIKHLHIALAAISILGFTWRGGLTVLRGHPLSSRFWRTTPHIIDTLLFCTGAWLAWKSHQYPFDNSLWLTTKMLALLAYIGFGLLAVRYASGQGLRIISYAVALGCAWLMVFTALNRTPLFL